jgi:hypothetical protein
MWADNETRIDLLGFDFLVDPVADRPLEGADPLAIDSDESRTWQRGSVSARGRDHLPAPFGQASRRQRGRSARWHRARTHYASPLPRCLVATAQRITEQ